MQLDVQPVTFEPRKSHFWGDDGSGSAYFYIYGSTRIKRRDVKRDVPLTIVGVVNQQMKGGTSSEGYRVSPRFPFDIIPRESPPPPVPDDWPNRLPETGVGPLIISVVPQ